MRSKRPKKKILFLGSKIVDKYVFLLSFFKDPTSVGSLIPSSSYLADCITAPVCGYVKERDRVKTNRPIKVLEVGAGTGVFTKKILETLKEDDQFDVIEIDEKLCNILRERFACYKNVSIHCLSILDWNPDYRYDFIISGLPFNAFQAEKVKSILHKYLVLVKERGVVSDFEYLLLGKMRMFFLFGQRKEDYVTKLKIVDSFKGNFLYKTDVVFLNFPPAYVYHFKINK